MEIKKGLKIKKIVTEEWERGLWGIDSDTRVTTTIMEVIRNNGKSVSIEERFEDGSRYTGYTMKKDALAKLIADGGKTAFKSTVKIAVI